jgi:hypothetical protein
MPVSQLPITNGFYVSNSLPISAQECTNWYVVVEGAPALAQETLRGTPGIEQVETSGVVLQANRGAHTMAGVPYFVNGGKLYRLDQTATIPAEVYDLVELGTIAGTARVSMADNGTQLMVLVPGGNGYIYNHVTDTFSQITDLDFDANGNPQFVVFVDGYFVCSTDTKKFIVSAINDGLSWNALDYGTAESDPDVIVAPIVFKNQLFISGSQTFEAFQNIGGSDFPFQRTGLFLDKGVFAPYSLITTQDTFMWVGGGINESPSIWAFAGNSTQKISSVAIDFILKSLTNDQLANIYSWAYSQNGAYFVAFALPNSTLVYDHASKRWHERKSYYDNQLFGYRISGMTQAYNHVFCGDQIDGRIGKINPDLFTEYGNNIIRTVATQPFQNNMQSIFVPSIELTVESGVGNTDSVDPVIAMDRSNDGKTWSDQRLRKIGKVGEYNRRAIWRRNGRASRFEVFRFTLSDPVKPVIIQLTADIIPGAK